MVLSIISIVFGEVMLWFSAYTRAFAHRHRIDYSCKYIELILTVFILINFYKKIFKGFLPCSWSS